MPTKDGRFDRVLGEDSSCVFNERRDSWSLLMIGNSGLIGIFKLHCLRPLVQVPLAQHPGDVLFFSRFFGRLSISWGSQTIPTCEVRSPIEPPLICRANSKTCWDPGFKKHMLCQHVSTVSTQHESDRLIAHHKVTKCIVAQLQVRPLFCWPTLFHCQLCPWPKSQPVAVTGMITIEVV